MSFSFSSVPKFVINLDYRTDRLEKTMQEFRNLRWTFERFDAIKGGVIGCVKSHAAVAAIALERNYDHVMICEDDNVFMPWALDMADELDTDLNSVSWSCCQLSPIPYRPVTRYASTLLMDLTDTPDPHKCVKADCPHYVAGTSCYVLDKLACNMIVDRYRKRGYEMPLDLLYSYYLYPIYQTVCSSRPLCLQDNDTSDIERGQFQPMTHKQRELWNIFCPTKI